MYRKFETSSSSNQIPQRALPAGAIHWEPPPEPAHGWKNMRPNVLKSLHIYEYNAGISGSEQKISSLSESTDKKNTSAEKQSRKENWVRFPGQLWSSVSTDFHSTNQTLFCVVVN
ncbi:hypothetical protein PVL29_014596 [Vitis rotundifolia]|uniref:Uncharacterized protein n=1 Tax=Vitis rotundifolia TaxID=103349 RepID=A0AA38ZH88_VITRO|nr:hypothetical protein PVL29_014596 [Vitis rotundifolia]